MVQKPLVSFETIVYILVNLKAPNDQLRRYLGLVDDLDLRKELAMKLKLTDLIVDVLFFCFFIQFKNVFFSKLNCFFYVGFRYSKPRGIALVFTNTVNSLKRTAPIMWKSIWRWMTTKWSNFFLIIFSKNSKFTLTLAIL